MKIGFSRSDITPAVGSYMSGWPARDRKHGCEGVHDNLYVRALYVTHSGQDVLILGFDLLMFSRNEVDRLKGVVGRVTGLSPWQILINTSHTHNGPKVGSFLTDVPKDDLYFDKIEQEAICSSINAQRDAVEATLWVGTTKTKLPMNRRKRSVCGNIDFLPNPDGFVYDDLPVAVFKNGCGDILCTLFSVSCHPSIYSSYDISADYPGVATALLDQYLDRDSSFFLQGCGGDSKPGLIKDKKDFNYNSWDYVEQAGKHVANDVIDVIENKLREVKPSVAFAAVDMVLPLQAHPGIERYEKIYKQAVHDNNQTLKEWAGNMLMILEQGNELPSSVPVTLQGIKLGDGVRLVGTEGETVAELGQVIADFYSDDLTFPLGYTNGTQMYIPTSNMIDEGGYEVDSFYEYNHPAPLAKGIDKILLESLTELKKRGIN